jgi:hypothetical protein
MPRRTRHAPARSGGPVLSAWCNAVCGVLWLHRQSCISTPAQPRARRARQLRWSNTRAQGTDARSFLAAQVLPAPRHRSFFSEVARAHTRGCSEAAGCPHRSPSQAPLGQQAAAALPQATPSWLAISPAPSGRASS